MSIEALMNHFCILRSWTSYKLLSNREKSIWSQSIEQHTTELQLMNLTSIQNSRNSPFQWAENNQMSPSSIHQVFFWNIFHLSGRLLATHFQCFTFDFKTLRAFKTMPWEISSELNRLINRNFVKSENWFLWRTCLLEWYCCKFEY